MQPSRRRVLCTENNADNLDLLKYLLTSEGFEVVATDDAQEALNLVQSGGFNLYILDVYMRKISGFELCKKLRELDAGTPVLFFTAAAFEADKKLAVDCGAQSFVTKPGTPETLVAEVLRLTSEDKTERESLGDFETA